MKERITPKDDIEIYNAFSNENTDKTDLLKWALCGKEYEELEEQGLIVRLPIPFGTELYFLHSHQHAEKPYTPTIHKTNKWTFEIWGNGESGISCDDLPCGYYGIYHHELGKTVFLSRPEAEKKLKEFKGEE